ncbi:25889_t:CDS:1, partial [Gigaspora margarita]
RDTKKASWSRNKKLAELAKEKLNEELRKKLTSFQLPPTSPPQITLNQNSYHFANRDNRLIVNSAN